MASRADEAWQRALWFASGALLCGLGLAVLRSASGASPTASRASPASAKPQHDTTGRAAPEKDEPAVASTIDAMEACVRRVFVRAPGVEGAHARGAQSSSDGATAEVACTMYAPTMLSGPRTAPSPMLARAWPRNLNFVEPGACMVGVQGVGRDPAAYALAGPMRELMFDPADVRAAIVTCGGLCPGLNTVIRELVMCLTYVYRVRPGCIFGIPNGYRGFYQDPDAWRVLTPETVARIHSEGGTVLGSSRGGFDADAILDAVTRRGVCQLYIIGGDGTHRGAHALHVRAVERGLRVCVSVVPKTIDNDIALLDRSFGVQTAVDAAVHPINCAHTEALAAKNGVGLVKLMGRSAGWIAMYASMASRDVNVTLLPEADWSEAALCAYVQGRLETRSHCVIVVAEGAQSMEQRARAKASDASKRVDESGNPVLDDIGTYLRDVLVAHFKKAGMPMSLKYIDPSYIIRTHTPNASDSELCTALAFNAVHGAMAGLSDFSVGLVDGCIVWLPASVLAAAPPSRVDTASRVYARMCTATGQPRLDEMLADGKPPLLRAPSAVSLGDWRRIGVADGKA